MSRFCLEFLMAVSLIAGACAEGEDTAMSPMDASTIEAGSMDTMSTTSSIGDQTTEARPGAVFTLGTCRIGVISMTRTADDVFADVVAMDDAGVGAKVENRQRVRTGQLLVACDAVHRIVGFTPAGGDIRMLVDQKPAAGVGLAPGTIVLAVEGIVRVQDGTGTELSDLVITQEAGSAVARFKVAGRGLGIPPVTEVQAKVGDLVTISGGRHRVIAIRPRETALGLPGWIEIDAKAGG
jgi:hypothetical protein